MVHQMWKWVDAAKWVEKELLSYSAATRWLAAVLVVASVKLVRSTWSTMWRAPAAARAWQLGHLPPGFEHQLSWLRAGGEEQDREFAYWVLGGGGK